MATVTLVARHLLNREGNIVADEPLYAWVKAFSALLKDAGHCLEVRQEGTGWRKMSPWGGPISAVPEQDPYAFFLPNLSQDLWEHATNISLAIYTEPALVYPQAHLNSITLGHSIPTPGVSGDTSTKFIRREWLARIKLGLSTVKCVVANNTQFIQWVVSTWPGLYHKLQYIPDWLGPPNPSTEVSPEKSLTGNGPPQIIFSSPALPQYGISEALRTVDILHRCCREATFVFCGTLPAAVQRQMEHWFEQRSCCRLLTSEKANFNYGDIALFPVKSGPVPVKVVLRAMQSGAVVIGSMHGPLVDMICHGYNGILIRPLETDLFGALKVLLENPSLRENMATRARWTGAALDQNIWIFGWKALLETLIGEVSLDRACGNDAGL